jgi:DNA-binding HxlR family transcriptional regulator
MLHRDVEEVSARPQPRRVSRPSADAENRREDLMAEVDRILDKILASGLDSLTEDERDLMKTYSQRNKPS